MAQAFMSRQLDVIKKEMEARNEGRYKKQRKDRKKD